MLGIIGEYLWRVFDEVNKRPDAVIEQIWWTKFSSVFCFGCCQCESDFRPLSLAFVFNISYFALYAHLSHLHQYRIRSECALNAHWYSEVCLAYLALQSIHRFMRRVMYRAYAFFGCVLNQLIFHIRSGHCSCLQYQLR
jgi:hypothetical protein